MWQKGEIACFEQFLLYCQYVFKKLSAADALEIVYRREMVKYTPFTFPSYKQYVMHLQKTTLNALSWSAISHFANIYQLFLTVNAQVFYLKIFHYYLPVYFEGCLLQICSMFAGLFRALYISQCWRMPLCTAYFIL